MNLAVSACALAVSFCLSCVHSPESRAGDNPPAAAKPAKGGAAPVEKADALFQAKKWQEAARAYRDVVKAHPQDRQAWTRLATSLHANGEWKDAVAAWHKVIEIRPDPITMYNLACSYARAGMKDQAFEWLNKSLDAGFPGGLGIGSDPDLGNLKEDSRYADLLKKAEKASKPCMFSEEHRQFDFWVGEWDVMNPAGQQAGTNKVEMVERGCIVMENWTGRFGGSGKSINFYDAPAKKWRQIWVDSTGGNIQFSGEYKDKAMRFTGETLSKEGKKVLRRLTFFHLGPDKVRQFSETSADGGAKWDVEYDFTYNRKK
jgi:tetratricopeptide (TPR) repeat protein